MSDQNLIWNRRISRSNPVGVISLGRLPAAIVGERTGATQSAPTDFCFFRHWFPTLQARPQLMDRSTATQLQQKRATKARGQISCKRVNNRPARWLDRGPDRAAGKNLMNASLSRMARALKGTRREDNGGAKISEMTSMIICNKPHIVATMIDALTPGRRSSKSRWSAWSANSYANIEPAS